MDKSFRKIFFYILLTSLSFSLKSNAQPEKIKNGSEIQLALEKLNVLGSVLYIGAHPDDENTGLMAYLSKGKKYRTAYLSLTRGDGGQNLIGSEKGSEIGILRTQELLQARVIDGGEQFFTRAIDFGYSKTPEESLEIWGKENVLSDIVWVIRKFKPDIIITRFPPDGNGGHGHHTASAQLAKEAFTAAADPKKFPEQLKYVQPWQTKRIFWNNFRPTQDEVKNLLNVDIGEYNPLLGKSYAEIAAESRSMHKSQGFGVSAFRGSRKEYFTFVDGENLNKDLFDGIITSWNRIKNGATIEHKLESIIKSFNPAEPSESLGKLIDLYTELSKFENNYWVDVKKEELLKIIQPCAGLWMEAVASDYSAAPGDEVNIKTTLVARLSNNLKVEKIEFPSIPTNSVVNGKLEINQPFSIESKIKIPESYPISQPYWSVNKPSKGLFSVSDQKMIGLAENPPSIPVKIYLNYDGTILNFTIPLFYRWNDRVEGELNRPFEIRPPVTANTKDQVFIFPDEKEEEVEIKLKNNTFKVGGEIHFITSANWKVTPSAIPFSFNNKYDEQTVTVKITPPPNSDEAQLKIELVIDGKKYNKSLVEISHPHIKRQIYLPDDDIKLVRLDVKKFDSKIGYVMGSGDEVFDCLTNMGYDVTLLGDNLLEQNNLLRFDAIVVGIRAYNTRERLKYDQPRLMKYVQDGGTLIVQYNVPSGLQTENIGPYPFKLSNDRITVEESPVTFVNPNHQLLNFPNKITLNDFDGWIQERGLYFANQWDSKYETIISGHDPNEKDLTGGMLFARYGKGIFIFSGYAWFRQLPAGVPGAYRIFANMISAGKYDAHSSK
ncbi:MAG: PIG-L family deacetylase [Ignavibacteriales bacterium]|nr:PIG-L family deacetylase [Ignavibacteriales bacterium]